MQDELFYDSRDYYKIILVTVMFSASTSSDSNTYDFFSDENVPKWNGIFISALNLVSIFKVMLKVASGLFIVDVFCFSAKHSAMKTAKHHSEIC